MLTEAELPSYKSRLVEAKFPRAGGENPDTVESSEGGFNGSSWSHRRPMGRYGARSCRFHAVLPIAARPATTCDNLGRHHGSLASSATLDRAAGRVPEEGQDPPHPRSWQRR